MEITASLFAFILFLAPGAVAVQAFFTAQRLSVVYSDTAFEKILVAVLAAPLCHGLAFFILEFLDWALWEKSPFSAAFERVMSAYMAIAHIGADSSPLATEAQASTFLLYFVFVMTVAAGASYSLTKLSIYFGGAPGYRNGIYSVVNGFLKTSVTASVVTEITSSEGCVLLYNGTVDKISYSKTGDIQFIYLSEPTRSVVKIAPKAGEEPSGYVGRTRQKRPSIKSFSSEMSEERLIGKSMLFNESDFPEISSEVDRETFAAIANERLFTGRFMIDGTHIKNIFFVRYLAPEQPLKSWIIDRLPGIFTDSQLRLHTSRSTYEEYF